MFGLCNSCVSDAPKLCLTRKNTGLAANRRAPLSSHRGESKRHSRLQLNDSGLDREGCPTRGSGCREGSGALAGQLATLTHDGFEVSPQVIFQTRTDLRNDTRREIVAPLGRLNR